MSKRNSLHIKAQKEGKQRDFYTCQVCGSIYKLEGHHFFDVQYGGAADTENIVSLCKECHKSVHSKKMDLIKC